MMKIESSEQESANRVGVDSCKHKVIYDNESNEHLCCKCGRVFSLEEVPHLVDNTVGMRSLGLNPNGKTNFWLTGIGTGEGYEHTRTREDQLKSRLANLAAKFRLNFAQLLELDTRLKKENSRRRQAQIAYSLLYRLKREDLADALEIEFCTRIARHVRHEALTPSLWKEIYVR